MPWRQRINDCINSGRCPTMVYQPIVRLSDGEVMGYEALARFPEQVALPAGLSDPEGSGWGPDVWFSHADLLGLRVDLELTAIDRALSAFDNLPGGQYITVNVSPDTLMADSAVAHAVAPWAGRVVVELTEHLAVTDYDLLRVAIEVLQQFKTVVPGRVGAILAAGRVRIAADDIGGGIASMAHLLELGSVLDFAKLDRSLTKDVEANRACQELIRGLVNVAEVDSFALVAEGVETRTQMDVLADLGVHYGQGWHLGRPGPLPTKEAA